LVLDEIQKIENWSEIIKKLWDHNRRLKQGQRVILLGSSSLSLQLGLSESLTGRFELLRAYHWNYTESNAAFPCSLDQYLTFGGYPGTYKYREDQERWFTYVKESIVETVIDKDILQIRKVERPALFKQVFELACGFPAQELSLRKLVGQLQDPGSIETVKHYLQLLEGAFLIKTLQKYSTNLLQKKSSSPKIIPLCTALCTFARGEVSFDPIQRGRLFELVVGLDILRLPGDLFYWRDGNDEVDYVYRHGKKVVAIEVKSGRKKSPHGLKRFCEAFGNVKTLIVSPENYLSFSKNPREFLK
jgi:predicted AAA+ superfamily ATPase